MFVDHIRIYAKAGDGGNGVASFRREKFVPKGGPDGGDGGKGGNVVLLVESSVDQLTSFFFEPMVKARDGNPGRNKQQFGKASPDVVVPVPVGTLVYRLPEGETISRKSAPDAGTLKMGGVVNLAELPEDPDAPARGTREDLSNMELVADLTEPGTRFILCKGGRGGLGNVHFKSSINRAPKKFTEGKPGEEGFFYFELRKIADIGLVGYPNAGKSTLLRAISAATPKVAPYPFTTLTPHIGVVDRDAYQRITVADIPGLVEGAHANVGLGHDFLRHIVRCKALCLVVDTAGSEGRDPVTDLQNLRKELSLYDPTLPDRPWLIAANKQDIEGAEENLKVLHHRFSRVPIVPITASTGAGMHELLEVFDRFSSAKDDATQAGHGEIRAD